jgi:ketosteroid isomerase-like protein
LASALTLSHNIRVKPFLLVALLLAADLKSELASLIETERAFARTSVEKGMRDAFLANFADDSIVFRPGPVKGRQWFEQNRAPTSQLSWEPAFADISAAGDLGYTTGPWEIRRSPRDAPAGFGHYVTVWRKQTDGKWKMAIDIGISHAAAPKPGKVESPPIAGDVQKALSEKELQATRNELLDAERKFPATSEAYASVLDPAARVYRNDSFPLTTSAAIRKTLSGRKGTFTWKLADSRISGSGDLAYTYGSVDFRPSDTTKPSETNNYFRIWKRQRGRSWTLVLDLIN